MNRLAIGLGAAVVVLAIAGAFRAAVDTERTPVTRVVSPLPTPTSTPPAPDSYDSTRELSSALEARGLPCALQEIDLKGAGHRNVDFANCFLLGEQTYNINLWLFPSMKVRDKWLLSAANSYVVFGPNWMVTPNDPVRARLVHGALGGTLKEPPP